MSKHHNKDELFEDQLDQENEEIIWDFEQKEDIIENQKEEIIQDEKKITKLQDALARVQADFDNFKKRTERDRDDMMFFLKLDIFKKILPRIDDIDRIIHNTPQSDRKWTLYEGIISIHKALTKDLEKLGIQSFESKGQPLNPDIHEVMTQIPWKEGIIIDEFEKWYMLWDRVLRVAKVVVGNWQ